MNISEIVQEAQDAARSATQAYLKSIGGDNYPCGFAWVRIKPARGPLVTHLKSIGLGKTDTFEGGYLVWNPSENHCQNMDAKHAGAYAFAEVLRRNGFKCSVGSRMD